MSRLNAIRRLPILSLIALAFIVLVVVVGIFSPWLVRHDPAATGLGTPLTGPNGDYWMGLDALGRDVFSRLVAGTPRSLVVGFGAASIALVAGTVLGAFAATSHKIVDEIIMRLLDIVMAFPAIVLSALLIIAFGKTSLVVLVLAIAFVFTPSIARVVRANVASQYGEDYVAAERVIGASRPHILWRHVLRNCAAPIMVFATVMVADAIVFEASLSFIGGGLQPQEAASSWGSVIALGKNLVQIGGWWATFFPGLLILVTVLTLNVLSEGISDAWAAPASRKATVKDKADTVDRLDEAAAERPSVIELPLLAAVGTRLRRDARPLSTSEPILEVQSLAIGFDGRHNGVDIVDDVSFTVRPGEVLGLVGESGCGKSLTAFTIQGLAPKGARIKGKILFEGRDLVPMPADERRQLMGRQIAMIYQDALSALNPSLKIGAQLRQFTSRGGTRSPEELMGLVGLDPERTLRSYPHQLSGGQRQRVIIAMALSRDPKLVIADEPTTALDVTVQAQVIQLLLTLQKKLGFALILVSHDLALVSDIADRVAVMYGGRLVEYGITSEVVSNPRHHYARGLLGSVLSLESGAERLTQIRGVVPSPADFLPGCRFADRCPFADETCRTVRPKLEGEVAVHEVACFHPADSAEREEVSA